jgi:hypothetical protein
MSLAAYIVAELPEHSVTHQLWQLKSPATHPADANPHSIETRCRPCHTSIGRLHSATHLGPDCVPARMASPAYFHDLRASCDLRVHNQPYLCGLCRHMRLRHVLKCLEVDELISTRFYFRSFRSTSAVRYVGWCASPGGFGARTTWPFITPNLVCTFHASVLCGWPILNLRITTGLDWDFGLLLSRILRQVCYLNIAFVLTTCQYTQTSVS